MEILFYVLTFIVGGIIAVIALMLVQNAQGKSIIKTATAEGEAIKKAKLLEVKEKYIQLKSEFDKQANSRNSKLQSQEAKLNQKEKLLASQEEKILKKEGELDNLRINLENQLEIAEKKDQELDKLHQKAIKELETIAGLSAEEAKNTMIESLKDEAKTAAMQYTNEIMEEAKTAPEPPVLTKPEMKRLLSNSGITDERIETFDQNFDHLAGENTEFLISNIAETRKFSIQTPDVVIKVNPERADLVETKIIDGRQCLVIEINDQVEVNGVPVGLQIQAKPLDDLKIIKAMSVFENTQ